jgi:Ca2+-binding RTX toxin-like protein
VNAQLSGGLNITLGNGNHDVVNAQNGLGDSIAVGNGNDTIYAGLNNTIAVGTGHDSFVFEYGPGSTRTTITGFDPHKDSFTFSTQITTAVSYQAGLDEPVDAAEALRTVWLPCPLGANGTPGCRGRLSCQGLSRRTCILQRPAR